VDDDQSITLVVQMSLQSEGYEVVTARNGREALEMVREHQPDMVVMDVMMPIMDGLSALRILKEDESTADIPVIMLTARTSEADVLSGWLRGADMYMTKPFDPWQLIANVNNIFFEDSKSDEEYFEKKQ
jgi:two-component system alkaline phosphatase synthesis response regulator PhoP/two-component system response regulator VicR